MNKLLKMLSKIFCLPPLPTLLSALFGYALIIIVAAFDIRISAIRYIAYVASAYALTVTITGLPYLKILSNKIRSCITEHPITKRVHSTKIGKKYSTDIRFRAKASLYTGFVINLLYIIMKMFSGIYYHSTWFVALAVYYILLAVMRLILLCHLNICDEAMELRRYRLCGIMLLLMNQALTGIVIFMVYQNKGFDYPGLLIYAMAFYSFYMVIISVVNIVKTRRQKSPVLSAAKAINFVAALVSILSLETAMLSQFGTDEDPMFRKVMTGATGGGVCTVVIIMAIYMIIRANIELKRLESDNS